VSNFTAPALLAFIASNHCVPPPVAPVIAGIAMHESGLSSTTIHDNVTGRSFNPETARDAVLLASTLITAGHDLDLGISQVNVRNFGWTGLTLQSAFDPCANLAAGVKVLFAKYNGSPPDTVKAAYAASVNGNLTKIDGAKDETVPPPPPPPPNAPDVDDAMHDAVHVHVVPPRKDQQ
jgi:hypothetical protein